MAGNTFDHFLEFLNMDTSLPTLNKNSCMIKTHNWLRDVITGYGISTRSFWGEKCYILTAVSHLPLEASPGVVFYSGYDAFFDGNSFDNDQTIANKCYTWALLCAVSALFSHKRVNFTWIMDPESFQKNKSTDYLFNWNTINFPLNPSIGVVFDSSSFDTQLKTIHEDTASEHKFTLVLINKLRDIAGIEVTAESNAPKHYFPSCMCDNVEDVIRLSMNMRSERGVNGLWEKVTLLSSALTATIVECLD